MKQLSINLSKDFIEAVGRRHNGRYIDEDERFTKLTEMQLLHNRYLKIKEKYDYCIDEWWDKKKIESYFMKPKWYYAHRKLKSLEKQKKDLHQQMFYLLVSTDGNYEPFDQNYCISVEEIFEDFNRKYNKLSTS